MGRRNKKSSKRTPKTPFEAVDKTEWEVEAIHAKRWAKGVLQYEVKWKDHVDKDNTWEPLENLVGAELSISDFEDAWEKNYNAPRKEKRTRQTVTSCATPLEELKRNQRLTRALIAPSDRPWIWLRLFLPVSHMH